MARPLRIEYEGALYHVTSRGNERKNIFFTKRDYEKFKEYVADCQKKYGFTLHCYVLMSNHYHLLVEVREKNLSKIMHFINSSYTMYTNTKRKRSGHLFQGRFKAIIVDKNNYLIALSKYIHLNPVRAKIVENPGDYAYSSYNAYTSDEQDVILSRSMILRAFAEEVPRAQLLYKVFVESVPEKDGESPFLHLYGGGILGDEDFVNEVLGTIEEEKLANEHISNRRALRATTNLDSILAQISDHFGMPVEEMVKRGRSERKVTVYLLKKFSDATNKQISKLIGARNSSTAAKIYEAFVKELQGDDCLKQQLERVGSLFH